LAILRRYEKEAGHPIFLLEDAAYRELRFYGQDVPSALAIEGFADRVIYAGTYSKPFATGIRVGFGLLPKALFEIVYRIKSNHELRLSFGGASEKEIREGIALLGRLIARSLEDAGLTRAIRMGEKSRMTNRKKVFHRLQRAK